MDAQVLILGGGAAGLMAGVALARNGHRVLLLEKGARVGKKLAATGNGRCNLTNLHACPGDYGSAEAFVAPALTAYPPAQVMRFFQSMGVVFAPDEEGRVYPMSNQASSVLDALRASFAEAGGVEQTEFRIDRIARKNGFWLAHSEDGQTLSAPYMLCAMGGQAAPNLGGCADGLHLMHGVGHRTRPCFPALTPLKCEHPRLRALKGIRAVGSVSLVIDGKTAATESGEILFQDYGLSGIAVMQLSGAAAQALAHHQPVELRLNLCGLTQPQALMRLTERRALLAPRPLENFLTGWLPKRLGQTLIRLCGADDLMAASDSLTEAQLQVLSSLMTGWTLPVTAPLGFQQAQVTRGGLDRADFDPETLASRLQAGLYAAGEVLDVDGPCGGYNLQWAWASALLAARSISGQLAAR